MGKTPSTEEAVVMMTALRAWASDLPGQVGRVQEGDVSGLVEELGRLSRSVDAARVALTAEAAQRGLPCNTGPFGSMGGDLLAWVTERSPGTPVGEVTSMVRVINGGRVRANAPLLTAVTSGRVGLTAADVALSEMGKLKPLLNPDAIETV